MLKRIHLLILTAIFIIIPVVVKAQSKWSNWEELYSDNITKIEIQFKIYKNSCDAGVRDNKYKYKVTGKYPQLKTIYWKLKYKDCYNSNKIKQNELIVGGANAITGIVESPDYIFKAKKIYKLYFDVGFNINNQKNNTTNKNTEINNDENNIVNSNNLNNTENKQNPKWTKWEKLYSDKTVTVQIQYLIHKNACKNGGRNNKFRYKITGLLHKEDKYVLWKMKYLDCNKNKQISINKIDVGKNGNRGTIESMDYTFTGNKILKNHYNEKLISVNNNTIAYSNKKKKNSNKIRPTDKKAYRVAKRRIRKTIPHKYSFLILGEGVYTNLGNTNALSTNTFTIDNIAVQQFNWFDSYGLYRKIWIKPKFTRKKGRDISRATLIGIFADVGYNISNNYNFTQNGLIKTEFGFNFWQWIRLSGGIVNYDGFSNFDNYLYSGTFGLNFKIRNWYINANYIQTADKSFGLINSYLHFGFGYALNFYRTVPKETKLQLKKTY